MDNSSLPNIMLPPIYNLYLKGGLHGYIVGIVIGSLISLLAKLINIPHQAPATIAGIIIGLAARYIGYFEDLVLNAHLLQSTYIPLMIAKLVYNMDHHILIKSIPQICIIALMGNTAFVVVLGLVIHLFNPSKVLITHNMIISVIIAPNDNPELPISDGIKNLETLMYGETILGISVCNIGRILLSGHINGHITEWYHGVTLFLRYFAFSIPIGLGCGWLMSWLFRELYNDSMNALAAYLSASYFVYILCEHICWCSGTLGSFLTLFLMTLQRTRFLTKTDQDVKLCVNVAYTMVQIFLTIFCIADSVNWIDLENYMIEIVETISAYLLGNVFRLILFLVASPILSRIGYGFEFASLVSICWSVQKGPLQLIQVSQVQTDVISYTLREALSSYVLTYVILTSLINGTTLNLILKAFGLIKLSNRRKANISIAINLLNDVRSKVLSKLKTNRFYSDVNWSLINVHTMIKNPFKDFASIWTRENVVCNVCSAVVPIKPTLEEYNEHLKDVTIRALKAQRVSFLEQHELGLLTKQDLELLVRAVNSAMESTNMNINMYSVLSCMNSQNAFVLSKRVRKILTINSKIKVPKVKLRKKIYYITTSIIFEAIMATITLIDVIFHIVRILIDLSYTVNAIVFTISAFCYVGYLVEMVLKITSFDKSEKCDDFKHYIRNHWNKIDLVVILIMTGDLISGLIWISNPTSNVNYSYQMWTKIFLLFKLCRILGKLYPYFVAYTERRKELKLMRAFGIAQGIVISCDDVISILPTFTEQTNIRDVIKTNLEQMRSTITQKMGLLEKARPSLTTTIKTRQALRSILKHLNEGIRELRASGLIDSFEFQKLYIAVTTKNKFLSNVRIMEVIEPTLIFNEIPWLYDEYEELRYVYRNVKNKIFNAGDVLCKPGDMLEGIYIIVAGYFKVTYYPTPELITRHKQDGELPMKEFAEYLRFDEVHEDFLSCGNRMGELAMLCNRPYHCSIVSEAPSQVFIIPKTILEYAKELSPDPVLGICARIWKSAMFGLCRRLLLTTTAYQSATKQEADNALIRAVVPNIDYYKVINLTKAVEDVLLLEGTVIDYNTREMYTAPCPLPKYVTKMLMPEANIRGVATKLMFIPESNVDEYNMMLTIQNISELVPQHTLPMLSDQTNEKRHFEGHFFSLSKQKSGTLSNVHKISGEVAYVTNEEE